jgi:transcription antitermination factor NusG
MESTTDHGKRWYALRVKSRFEKTVSRNLKAKGYEEFLPLALHRRRWSDRVKEISTALFPGYVFCRFDPVNRLPILQIPGVTAVAGPGKTFMPVDDRELDNVRALLKSGIHCQPWPFVTIGETVSVERGSLSGLEGIVTKVKNEFRLVISVSLLQRSVAVEIDRDDVRPVANPRKGIEATRVLAGSSLERRIVAQTKGC